jgi:hypothetical protein
MPLSRSRSSLLDQAGQIETFTVVGEDLPLKTIPPLVGARAATGVARCAQAAPTLAFVTALCTLWGSSTGTQAGRRCLARSAQRRANHSVS